MKSVFLLMAQYDALALIPLDRVCRDYFPHLKPEKFLRKVNAGEIDIPVVRMENSQKCAKGVHVEDMAAYLDKRREAAIREAKAINS